MGLDFTVRPLGSFEPDEDATEEQWDAYWDQFGHPDWSDTPHWSYSGFMRFRTAIAKIVGIDLLEMEGFGSADGMPFKPAPLTPLLSHSDCDGDMSPSECKLAAPALRVVCEQLTDEHDRAEGILLSEMMEWCGKNDYVLVFT